jgi:tRNA(Arg) A34 adenosine deaminase TadA
MKRADWETFMLAALGEAELSFREGNCGFGAVIVKDGMRRSLSC